MNNMQGAPKYAKIILTFIPDTGIDEVINVFEDCGMVLTSDKLIIVKDSHDSISNMLKTEGLVFELNKLLSYQTFKPKQ